MSDVCTNPNNKLMSSYILKDKASLSLIKWSIAVLHIQYMFFTQKHMV